MLAAVSGGELAPVAADELEAVGVGFPVLL